MTSSNSYHGTVVWFGKPWIVPAAIIRTIAVIVVAIVFIWLEVFSADSLRRLSWVASLGMDIVAFALIWLVSMLELLIFRASNTYVLRQDGLEVKRGIIRLHSFVVTPAGLGDLLVYQSIGGRIFGYGDITVNSQGERETRMQLVRSPNTVADTMRDIMGKPIVRVEDHV